MIEKVYQMTRSESKTIEKVIQDEFIHYMHMILAKNEGLPLHTTNANLYMTVVRGTLTLQLEDEDPRRYEAGTILNIPFGVKMDAHNTDAAVLELFVVKSPAPKMA